MAVRSRLVAYIFESTIFTSLFLLQLFLLGITPASLIYESIAAKTLQYPFIVGIVCIVTALVVVFIYTNRLYTNRTVLADVGKNYIPIEDGEVPVRIHGLIKRHLERSALRANECRPRNVAKEERERNNGQDEVGRLVKMDPQRPPWGLVRHDGWSSPNPNETLLPPNTCFATVIKELPNLLEARVVSLGGPPRIKIDSINNRTILLTLQEYIHLLLECDELQIGSTIKDFLTEYDSALSSYKPLSEKDFHKLTTSFAGILSDIQPSTRDNITDGEMFEHSSTDYGENYNHDDLSQRHQTGEIWHKPTHQTSFGSMSSVVMNRRA